MDKITHKYFLAESYSGEFTAGVVRQDMETLLLQSGYKKIRVKHQQSNNPFFKLLRFAKALQLFITCKRNGIMVWQLPIQPKIHWFIHRLLKWKGLQTVALVIDLDGVRDDDTILMQKELDRLQKFDHIIVHNKAMKDFLLQKISGKKMYSIGFFDYLSPETMFIPQQERSYTIACAANFEKGTYIYQLPTLKNKLHFNLYGIQFDNDLMQPGASNYQYKGVVDPKELPAQLEGSFGLVWDGPSIHSCEGSFGNYLAINNPHKSSLYLVAGLPLVVWKQSALTKYVEKEGIGFAISSIFELEEKINGLTNQDYLLMSQKARSIGHQLQKGNHLQKVLNAIESGTVNEETV